MHISLPFLPPHIVAKVENIFVSAIFHSKYLKEYGNKKCFSKTIEDLKALSTDGIKVSIDGEEITLYFECVSILGDNLGLNCICGFAKNFVGNYYCRICRANKEECQKMTLELIRLLKTKKSYEEDVLIEDCSKAGVFEECIFNKLDNFHIWENITVDIMHDLYEGIASDVIGKILKILIQNKFITLEEINTTIKNFAYNDIDKQNKPRRLAFCQAKKGKKLNIKQSASEMLCLARNLGLMIDDCIPYDNKHWKLYRYLRNIIGVLTSLRLDKGQMLNLQTTIQKFIFLYHELFGKIKPKMHFLLHYPRAMILNGPVVHFSAMKFERKNKALKDIVVATSSNMQLPLTIAIRH